MGLAEAPGPAPERPYVRNTVSCFFWLSVAGLLRGLSPGSQTQMPSTHGVRTRSEKRDKEVGF